MKIIFAYGSTRPASASQKLLNAMADSARAAGHTVLRYSLTENLNGCHGCAACRKGAGNCVRLSCQKCTESDSCTTIRTSLQERSSKAP